MTPIYVDATTLIGLGTIGELRLLESVEGQLIILPSIRAEVTSEPAKTSLERFIEHPDVTTSPPRSLDEAQAMELLDEREGTGDTRLIGAVLAHTAADERVGIVSDDRRMRTVSRGLGATVTGTIGVVVRAVDAGRSPDEGTEILRQLDEHGLHMTAQLREKAEQLIASAGS